MADNQPAAPAADEAPLSIHDAAGLMRPPEEPTQTQGDAPAQEAEAAPQDNSALEADAGAPEQEPTGETEGEPDTAEETQPPIDPPKSWTKAEKEAFKALPRDTQQSLVERERARDTDVSRRLSEAAERAKGADARSAAAEQARQAYEAALPNVLSVIQQQLAGEFQDINSWEALNQMREQDPIRYLRWDAATKQAEQLSREVQTSQARQQQENMARFEAYKVAETQKFLEAAPEFADPKTQNKMQSEVQAMFADVGIAPEELKGLWNGQPISLHDHRVQLIIRDAARYRAAKNAVNTAKPKPAAPVQRPGVATNRGEVVSAQVKQLDASLTRTGSRRDALALLNGTSRRN